MFILNPKSNNRQLPIERNVQRTNGIVIYITLLQGAVEHLCLEVVYKHCIPTGFRRLESLATKTRC